MRSSSSSANMYSTYTESSNFHLDDALPNNSHTKQFQKIDYPDELFSFDAEIGRRGAQNDQQLSRFEQDAPCDLIAMTLIEENSYLKQCLRNSQRAINQLQSELSHYRQELFNQQEQIKKQRTCFQNKTKQFRSEIMAIMSNNKQMEAQFKSLKAFLGDQYRSKSGERLRAQPNAKSLDKLNLKQHRQFINCTNQSNISGRKGEELIDSIKSMHFKVMGFQTDSLRDLWRWLKDIAQIYSSLRRWQDKFADLSAHCRGDKWQQAVLEVFQMLD